MSDTADTRRRTEVNSLVNADPGDTIVLQPSAGSSHQPGGFLRWFSGKAHWLFLIIAVPLLLVMVTVNPVGNGMDEQTHTLRAWQISQFNLFPGPDGSDTIPVGLDAYIWSTVPSFHDSIASLPDNYGSGAVGIRDSDLHVNWSNSLATNAYFPMIYFPGAAGFLIANALNTSVSTAYWLARAGQALAFCVIGFIALFLVRRTRMSWLIFASALLPVTLFQSSYVTADTLSLAFALLFAATLFNVLLESAYSRSRTIWLLCAASLLTWTKPTVVVFLLLLLMVPGARLATHRWRGNLLKAIPFAVLAGSYLLLNKILHHLGIGASVTSSGGSVQALFEHPVYTARMFFQANLSMGGGYLTDSVAQFGYNSLGFVGVITLVICLISLTLAGFYAEKLTVRHTSLFFLLACVLFAGATESTFLAVGQGLNYGPTLGIQGRYFTYGFPFIIYALTKLVPLRVREHLHTRLPVTITVLSLAGPLLVVVYTWWMIGWINFSG
ncbi:MAG: DUF2142 domain-containing protein [Propionibacteriaceae bacterium]|nr:DUF2142 domain-containing protein [Propionibacteriaceae bacterium]